LNKLDYRFPFRIGITLLFDRSPKAIKYLETAKELYPANPNILSWLSVAYAYVEKDVKKTEIYIKEAEKYNTKNNLDFSFAQGVLELTKETRTKQTDISQHLRFIMKFTSNSIHSLKHMQRDAMPCS